MVCRENYWFEWVQSHFVHVIICEWLITTTEQLQTVTAKIFKLFYIICTDINFSGKLKVTAANNLAGCFVYHGTIMLQEWVGADNCFLIDH